ncbi:MAG: hypothetical protein QXR89_07880 [Candidatus Bathyarchaeia archaeon]
MRSYIFTPHELEALEQFIKTRKRNPTVNKIVHYIRHNQRLLTEIQLLLALMPLLHKRSREKPKLPPGRPPKLISNVKKAV